MPEMAEGCDSAFIGKTHIAANPGLYRAGNHRESDPSNGNHPFMTVRSSDDAGFRISPAVSDLLSGGLFTRASAGGSLS